jgi:putative cell wall-binding protein
VETRVYSDLSAHEYGALMDGELPDQVWLDGAFELLRRSDIVVLMPNWKSSKGTVAEEKYAREIGKEIVYLTETAKPERKPMTKEQDKARKRWIRSKL